MESVHGKRMRGKDQEVAVIGGIHIFAVHDRCVKRLSVLWVKGAS